MRARSALFALAFAAAAAGAQSPPAAVPVVDPASALHGKTLLDALRSGGHVLFVRHARQGRYTEACTESNLTPESEAQTRQVGATLRELRIPVGLVQASKLCRAIDTARLLDLGDVDITPDLNPGVEVDVRRRLLAKPPPPGTNTILVSHGQTAEKVEDRLILDWLETIVFRPDGHGGAVPVARIRGNDWETLPK